MLDVWLEAIRQTSVPEVQHLVFAVGEKPPKIPNLPDRLLLGYMDKKDPFSIGHVHNLGAQLANTEWIMKLDIDTLPTMMFFRELIGLLGCAGPREWFNCGMIYFKQHHTHALLSKERMPLGPAFLNMVCQNLASYSNGYHWPCATNFICRTQDYLDLGGCDPRFNGYGWEDYQQIYMLERYQQAKDPLPGPINLLNVTQRCRDEISRRKALELFKVSQTFCLFHRWHIPVIKNQHQVELNRRLLLEWIEKSRETIPLQ